MQVIIIGCGKVGSSLARELMSNGHVVVIIENDKKLLQNADDLDCLKINGVPIDKDVLKSAGIEQADALCAVTSDDNMNLMTAQVAREIFKVKKVIARIFNPISKELFEEFGLDTICSTTLSVNAIYRALEDEEDYVDFCLTGTEVCFSGMALQDKYIGLDVTELATSLGKHIAGFIRNNKLIVAMPGMKTEKGDSVAILSMQNMNRGNKI
ncbi:MAG: potassium channel family protein [Saccharofermentanales bacterium]